MPTNTWSSGNTFTASHANTYIRDIGVNAACVGRADGAQTVATATDAGVTLVTEDYDTDGMHSILANQSRFIPTYSGYYYLSGYVQLSANTGGNYRQVAVWKNGSSATLFGFTRRLAPFSSVWASVLPVMGVPVFCNGSTDYLEAVVRHDSGSTRTVTAAVVSCHRLRA